MNTQTNSCSVDMKSHEAASVNHTDPFANVPPEKLQAMKDYAVLLRKKFPQMRPARLQRKVAEHFKIKLIK